MIELQGVNGSRNSEEVRCSINSAWYLTMMNEMKKRAVLLDKWHGGHHGSHENRLDDCGSSEWMVLQCYPSVNESTNAWSSVGGVLKVFDLGIQKMPER